MTPLLRHNLSVIGVVSGASGLIGILYGLILSFIIEFEWGVFQASLAGTTGAIVGAAAMLWQLLVFRGAWAGWLRDRPFWLASLVKLLVLWFTFSLSIRAVRAIFDVFTEADLWSETSILSVWRDDAFSLLITAAFVFVTDIRALVGPSTFWGLSTGRYHRPRNEDRIFMLVDVADSTQIAKKIGNQAFHDYLSDLFNAFDIIVTEQRGEVVNYIGDALLASWDQKKRHSGRYSIKAGHRILDKTVELTGSMQERYGVVPCVRVVMHNGPVVIGETGVNKRQITMLGDAINVTARLESVAKETGHLFLISGPLFSEIGHGQNLNFVNIGHHALKGVTEPMEIYSLNQHGTGCKGMKGEAHHG